VLQLQTGKTSSWEKLFADIYCSCPFSFG
jgi:hypothetical protein